MEIQINPKQDPGFLTTCLNFNMELIDKLLKHYDLNPADDPTKANILIQTYADLIVAEYRRKYDV